MADHTIVIALGWHTACTTLTDPTTAMYICIRVLTCRSYVRPLYSRLNRISMFTARAEGGSRARHGGCSLLSRLPLSLPCAGAGMSAGVCPCRRRILYSGPLLGGPQAQFIAVWLLQSFVQNSDWPTHPRCVRAACAAVAASGIVLCLCAIGSPARTHIQSRPTLRCVGLVERQRNPRRDSTSLRLG